MTTFLTCPDLGEGLPDAEIVAWHVAEGDSVIKTDDLLVSVETAKAVVEVPSPVHRHRRQAATELPAMSLRPARRWLSFPTASAEASAAEAKLRRRLRRLVRQRSRMRQPW